VHHQKKSPWGSATAEHPQSIVEIQKQEQQKQKDPGSNIWGSQGIAEPAKQEPVQPAQKESIPVVKLTKEEALAAFWDVETPKSPVKQTQVSVKQKQPEPIPIQKAEVIRAPEITSTEIPQPQATTSKKHKAKKEIVKPVETVKIEPVKVSGDFWDLPEGNKQEDKKAWSNVESDTKKLSLRDIQREEIDANKNKPKPEKPKLPEDNKEVLWTASAKAKPKSLREIQEEELKRQQIEKELLDEEKRNQAKNLKPAAASWTAWYNTDNKKSTIREIQEQELKQKDTNEEEIRKYDKDTLFIGWEGSTHQKSTVSIKDIQKEELSKSKPIQTESKEIIKEQQIKKTPLAPNPWGTATTQVKSLREIQAEESGQKIIPKVAPVKEESSLFWDVPDEDSKTKSTTTSESDFPSLNSASKKQVSKQTPTKQYAQALLQHTPTISPKPTAKTDIKPTPSKKKTKMQKVKPELLGFNSSSSLSHNDDNKN